MKISKIYKCLSDRKSGLTLIEVVLTILIVGISVTSILSLQGTLSRGVFSAHNMLERISYIKNMFVTADKDKLYTKDAPVEKKIEDPSLQISYSRKKSPLKNFEHIIIEQVDAQWPSVLGTRKESFITFRFEPKVEK